MSERINTLLISANGTHPIAVAAETLTRGLFGVAGDAPEWINRHRVLRQLFGQRYVSTSYLGDWHDAFAKHPRLRISTCNITNLRDWWSLRRRARDFDLIVVLHSAAGDRLQLLMRAAPWLADRRGKLAIFVANEYELMAEKMHALRAARADLVCTQMPQAVSAQVYDSDCGRLLETPHALNPDAFHAVPGVERDIDIGFVGDLYDRLIGDRERTQLIEWFRGNGASRGLHCDIRVSRMPQRDWVRFLNQSRAVIGAESGTYFLRDLGRSLEGAKRYLREHPDATFDEVFAACFAQADRSLCGKAISSRHFEPIGTRTCQLLVEGYYNGILQADVHYIAIKKDLSNIDDAIRRFKDETYRRSITETAYQHVMANHTYAHRVDQVVEAAFG